MPSTCPTRRARPITREHVKTSIAIQALDVEDRRLGYFHNAGYYELQGRTSRASSVSEGPDADPASLPPYVEVVKLPDRAMLSGGALVDSIRSISFEPTWRGARDQPVPPLRDTLSRRSRLAGRRATRRTSTGYAFATLRQCGAAFELGGAYLRWLERCGECGLEAVAAACDTIATTAKALQFKTARRVSTGRSFDAAPMLETMATMRGTRR